MSERELSLITGLSLPLVASALDRLSELGVIAFVEAAQSAPGRSEGPRPNRSTPIMPPPDPGRSSAPPPLKKPHSSHPPSAIGGTPPLYDPAELDEDVEIEPERRRRVLDLFYRLEELTYYQILGVNEHADKKQIKSAYYALAPEFHPDKYFRKRLGSYKVRIEAIFNRITQAHDVLTSKPRRAEYDEYVEQTSRNRAMAAILAQTPRDVARVSAAVDESAASVAGVEPPLLDGAPPSVAAAGANLSSPGRYSSEAASHAGGSSSSSPPAAPSQPLVELAPESPRSRRETLARKLGGGLLRRSAPPPSSPMNDPMLAQRAAEALRFRYESALAEARRIQLHRYLDLGRGALDRKDFAGAANAYRIAAALAPDDREVQTTCEEAVRLAAGALAEGYLKQAQYEENQGRWAEAALSYSKACAGRPGDGRAHERVAFATLKSSANTRRAVEFARKAVELDPSVAEFRLTLASAYAAAGFEKSASGEITRALALAPNDPKIRDLSASVREQAQKNGKSG